MPRARVMRPPPVSRLARGRTTAAPWAYPGDLGSGQRLHRKAGRWADGAGSALHTLEAAGRRGNPDRIRREDPPPLLADLDCAVPDLIRCSASARALSSQSVDPATGARAMDQRPHAQDLRPTAQRARPSAAKRSIARTAICQTAPALGGAYCDGPPRTLAGCFARPWTSRCSAPLGWKAMAVSAYSADARSADGQP